MKPNIASRLGTETPFLKDLISGVRKGEIKVPQFQRKFVWKEEQAINLLDSIGSNYPIGSLLLWRTTSKLATERNLGEFKLPDTDDLSPTEYVLDGQQRLTVIYSCFGAHETDDGFQAVFDLESASFAKRPEDRSLKNFPLRILYDTTKLLNFRSGLVGHPQAEELQRRLDQLIDVITNYRIPVVILKDLSVEEVCPIFERINSSGTRLSIYDLMVAATWSEDFDLNEEAETISSSLAAKGFGDVEGDTVLKVLSAIHNRGIKKDEVLSLRKLSKPVMDALVEQTRAALLKTVDLLSTEFNVFSWDFLPYEAYVVILAYVFAKRKRLTPSDVKRVRQWFWKSAFSERYRGASEHYISRDLEYIDEYIINQKEPDAGFSPLPTEQSLSRLGFRSNNSRSRAYMLLLSLKSPRNITNGALIDTAEALSSYNKKQFHHVYPKAHLKREANPGEHNALVNICMLAASENIAIGDEDPNKYLPRLVASLGAEAAGVFRSNLLPDPAKFDYSNLSYSDFVKARSTLVHEQMSRLIEGEGI